MRTSNLLLTLLASIAVAQPHHKQVHQHAKHHEARNQPAITWVTEYEYTTEVIPVTTTIWVSEGFVAPTPETTSKSSSTTTKTPVPAQFFQPASVKPASSSTTLSTVVSVAPAPAPISTSSAQSTTTTTSVAPPPPPPAAKAVDTSTSTTSTIAVPSPEPTPVSVYTPPPPPAQPTTTIAPAYVAPVVAAVPSADSSSGSSGGECSKGNGCTGDITFYEAGLGACGWTTDGETEDVIALSHLLMGTQSNGNPYCGKTVTIKLHGKSIVAKVVDKCMGCEPHAIDLSNHAFKQLEDFGVGRTKAEWYFN